MSRSGYCDGSDMEQWEMIRWQGAVSSAIRGKRGQAMLRDLLAALDAMPEKRLVADELELNGEVCALGALGRARGIDMTDIDPEDSDKVGNVFGVAPALAREIVFQNDEVWGRVSDEERWRRVRAWVADHIRADQAELPKAE